MIDIPPLQDYKLLLSQQQYLRDHYILPQYPSSVCIVCVGWGGVGINVYFIILYESLRTTGKRV